MMQPIRRNLVPPSGIIQASSAPQSLADVHSIHLMSGNPDDQTGVVIPRTIRGAASVFEAQRFASMNDGYFKIFDAAASIKILEKQTFPRNMLGFSADDGNLGGVLYVAFGQPANVYSFLKLQSGQTVIFDNVVPQDDVWVYGTSIGGAISCYMTYSLIGI